MTAWPSTGTPRARPAVNTSRRSARAGGDRIDAVTDDAHPEADAIPDHDAPDRDPDDAPDRDPDDAPDRGLPSLGSVSEVSSLSRVVGAGAENTS